jgi:hypothetical protein
VYGAVGPKVTLRSGLALAVDPAGEPWWWLDGAVSADAVLDLPVLDVSSESLELYANTFRLAEAEPRAPAVTLANTAAHLTNAGFGVRDDGFGRLESTSSIDARLVQHAQPLDGPAEEPNTGFLVPVTQTGTLVARKLERFTQSCPEGADRPTGVVTTELLGSPGGTSRDHVWVQVGLEGRRPVSLMVPSFEEGASAILVGAEVLRETETTHRSPCYGDVTSDERSGAGSFVPFFLTSLNDDATRSSPAPTLSITPRGCDSEGTCTYHASYRRTYAETGGSSTWSATSAFELETDIVVSLAER